MGRADFGLLKELVSKVPWESAFEGIWIHECWSLFKSQLLRAQEQANPKCCKSGKWSRSLAQLSRDLLELSQKRKVYRHWHKKQVTVKHYRDTVHHCGGKIHAPKAQLEFKLASTVRYKKGGFYKCVNSKRRFRDNASSLTDEVCHVD